MPPIHVHVVKCQYCSEQQLQRVSRVMNWLSNGKLRFSTRAGDSYPIPHYRVVSFLFSSTDQEASPGYTQGSDLVDPTGRDLGDYYGRLVSSNGIIVF